ncbi:MAG TPA: diguanylate cyclase [Methylibium sp.]|uniref:diguanylate cyclase domain-containing protein n=1 Tax=Methylibium sp. TaxID=2067992 RepID=UPI002DBF5517|nr:diguanylate cyclase [Methylibium sp.]HEU4460056.1 diguanylate cyclase [Methylibium sp.]
MNESPDADDAHNRALQREIAEARSTLKALNADIVDAEVRLHGAQSDPLLQANEQLVLAMLKAQGEADTVAVAFEAASHSACHDALTGLPNRSLFDDRFAQATAHARRHQLRMALLFIDLNDFKSINDRLGHSAGDALLVEIAARLLQCVRGADTVCRFGGDEFVVLVPEVSSVVDAGFISEKLLAAVAQPLAMRGEALAVTASVGIALYPEDARDEEALLDCADAAMYGAKARGGGYCFYAASKAEAAMAPQRRRSTAEHALDEQRRMNELLRGANEQLVMAALGAAELQETAERALARHQTYLALLGHEIRNPLSPLRYVAALLEGGPHPQTLLMRLRQTIERQVHQIARLVDDMLALSSTQRAQLDVARHPADFVDLLQQAIDTCRAATEARRQTLEFSTDAPSQLARVDPLRMVQVITNLIDNASKYTPPEGRITVTLTGSEAEVCIRVADNGIGISFSDTQTLFEPFLRAPEALASGSAGLGIGLTVVRELVVAHQGSIEVRSAGIGQGSEFIVRLPR